MAEFRVTITELKNKAAQLEQYNQQFNTQVGALEQTEAALNGMWEGEAKTSFDTAFKNDIIQMRNFYNAIAQYVTALNNIAIQYGNAEAQNIEIASTRNY